MIPACLASFPKSSSQSRRQAIYVQPLLSQPSLNSEYLFMFYIWEI